VSRRVPTVAIPATSVLLLGWNPPPLYRSAEVLVTYDVFALTDRQYRIAALDQVCLTRRPGSSPGSRGLLLAGVGLAALGVALATGTQSGWVRGAILLLALLAAAAPALILAVTGRLRPCHYEIWGRYGGRPVRLFVTDDQRVFGQVTRALRRAREAYLDLLPLGQDAR